MTPVAAKQAILSLHGAVAVKRNRGDWIIMVPYVWGCVLSTNIYGINTAGRAWRLRAYADPDSGTMILRKRDVSEVPDHLMKGLWDEQITSFINNTNAGKWL
jgi:hypothetical protein